MKKPLIISMHMEKCGGTSLTSILRRRYGSQFQLYDPGYPQQVQEFLPMSGLKCLHGHMYYGLHRQTPQYESQYITVLREPRARFYSNYLHIRRFEHPLHSILCGANGLQKFCTHARARPYRNLFVRRLAEAKSEMQYKDLDLAEKRLRQFSLVGCIEHFSDFVGQASRMFGWPETPAVHHNSSELLDDFNTLSRAEVAMITKANSLDIELWERIQDLIPQ